MPLARDLPVAIGVFFMAFRHVDLEYKSLQNFRRKRLSRQVNIQKGVYKKNLEFISVAGESAKHRL